MLDLQPTTIVFQIINFLTLVFVLWHFLYRPVLKTMQERQAAITAQLDSAAKREAEAVATRKQLEEQAAAARAESERARAQVRAEASAERERLLAAAREETSRLQDSAQLRIREDEQSVLRTTAAHVRATAASLAGTLIRQAAGQEVHQALVDQFITTGLPAPAAAARQLRVELAYPANADLQRRVAALTHAHVTFIENPDLIAGVRILASDQLVVEFSVRHTLDELQSRANGEVVA